MSTDDIVDDNSGSQNNCREFKLGAAIPSTLSRRHQAYFLGFVEQNGDIIDPLADPISVQRLWEVLADKFNDDISMQQTNSAAGWRLSFIKWKTFLTQKVQRLTSAVLKTGGKVDSLKDLPLSSFEQHAVSIWDKPLFKKPVDEPKIIMPALCKPVSKQIKAISHRLRLYCPKKAANLSVVVPNMGVKLPQIGTYVDGHTEISSQKEYKYPPNATVMPVDADGNEDDISRVVLTTVAMSPSAVKSEYGDEGVTDQDIRDLEDELRIKREAEVDIGDEVVIGQEYHRGLDKYQTIVLPYKPAKDGMDESEVAPSAKRPKIDEKVEPTLPSTQEIPSEHSSLAAFFKMQAEQNAIIIAELRNISKSLAILAENATSRK